MLLFVHFREFPTPPSGSAHYPFIQFQLLFSTYASPFHYQHFLLNTSGLLCDCLPPLYWFIVCFLFKFGTGLLCDFLPPLYFYLFIVCSVFVMGLLCDFSPPFLLIYLYICLLIRVSCAIFRPRFVDLFVYLSFDMGLLRVSLCAPFGLTSGNPDPLSSLSPWPTRPGLHCSLFGRTLFLPCVIRSP